MFLSFHMHTEVFSSPLHEDIYRRSVNPPKGSVFFFISSPLHEDINSRSVNSPKECVSFISSPLHEDINSRSVRCLCTDSSIHQSFITLLYDGVFVTSLYRKILALCPVGGLFFLGTLTSIHSHFPVDYSDLLITVKCLCPTSHSFLSSCRTGQFFSGD